MKGNFHARCEPGENGENCKTSLDCYLSVLRITTDGRKIGLDQRLVDPMFGDFEGSKVNACVDNVFNIWNDTKDKSSTQLVFSDFSTPNRDGRFNIYDDIKVKLIARGVPKDEIAFIHDADTEEKKDKLFAKVRQGSVRALLGSTQKMGAGVNVQNKLIAIHHVDCPWRPRDLEQRDGRGLRQGNENEEIKIFRYVTENTFDAYLYQMMENKQRIISQVMTSKAPMRSYDDLDESVLSYAEVKALCAGNPLIKEKMDLDIDVARLKLLKSSHMSQIYRLEDDIMMHFPARLESARQRIAGLEQDAARLERIGAPTSERHISPMLIDGRKYTIRKDAGNALMLAVKKAVAQSGGFQGSIIGSWCGFDMGLAIEESKPKMVLKGDIGYKVELGEDASGNITRLNHALLQIPERLQGALADLDNLNSQLANAMNEVKKSFAFDNELLTKGERLAFLNAELDIDKSQNNQIPELDEAKEQQTERALEHAI